MLTCYDDCKVRDLNAKPLIINPNTIKYFPPQQPVVQLRNQSVTQDKRLSRYIIKCTDLFVSTLRKHNSKAHGPLHAE